MKREIKFRFFYRGDLCTVTEMYFGLDGSFGVTMGFTRNVGVFCPDSDHVTGLTQYTGLKDKNGVEIYEGDILKISNGSINGMLWMDLPRVVEQEFNGWTAPRYCWDKDGSIMDSTHWCEVIGNVHQHPELLKP